MPMRGAASAAPLQSNSYAGPVRLRRSSAPQIWNTSYAARCSPTSGSGEDGRTDTESRVPAGHGHYVRLYHDRCPSLCPTDTDRDMAKVLEAIADLKADYAELKQGIKSLQRSVSALSQAVGSAVEGQARIQVRSQHPCRPECSEPVSA
jgi:hypothetical protein